MSTFSSTNTGVFLNNVGENPATIATGAYVTNTTTAFSGDAVVGYSLAAWDVDNFGTVTGGGNDNFGIFLAAGGVIVNQAAAVVTGTDGIGIKNVAGTAVNYGTIKSNATGTLGGNAVYIGAGGLVINYGTIVTAAGSAIQLEVGGTAINHGVVAASSSNSTVFSEDGVGLVTNFGTIVNSNSNAVHVAKGAVVNEINGLIVGGRSGDGITIGTPGTGQTYVGIGTVTNYGTITAGASGHAVYVGDGGLVTNAGLISAVGTAVSAVSFHKVAGSVSNTGTILSIGDEAVYFQDGGSVTNGAGLITSGDRGIQVLGGPANITNAGTIAHTGAGTSGQAVYLGAGGLVVNSTNGLISGSRPGTTASGYPGVIEAHGQPATVTNLGTITNPNDSNGVNLLDGGLLTNGAKAALGLGTSALVLPAVIYAPHQAVYVGGTLGVPTPGAIGTIVNYGTIANGTSLAAAITLVSGGTGINHGLITSPRTGIAFKNSAGAIDNFGTIASTAPTTYSHGSGAYFAAGGLITNEVGGLITAQKAAVSLAGTGTTGAAATISNFGLIVGSVGVAIGAGDTGNNTVVNDGTITGTSGVAIQLGSGNDAVVIATPSQLNGAIGGFHPGDTIDLANVAFDPNGTVNLKPGNVLSVFENGGASNFTLASPLIAGDVFTLSPDAGNGTLISESPGTAPYAVTDPLMTNASGTLVFDQVTGGQIVFTTIGGLGSEWEFDGAGFFLNNGNGNPGFVIRDTGNVNPGALFVGEVANGAASFTPIGGLGLEWQFEGNADFLGTGLSEFLIRNTGTVEPGTLDLGQVVNGAVQYTQIGGLGLEWQFAGSGNFLGDGNQGFLIRNTGAAEPGALDVGEVVNGTAQFTPIGGLGLEWNFAGTGDFFGDGHTDFLVENSGTAEPGTVAIGEVDSGQLNFTTITGLGPEWQFVGTGNYIDSNKTDFLLRDTADGALVVGSVTGALGNATANFTTVGGIGPEWSFHLGNAALLA